MLPRAETPMTSLLDPPAASQRAPETPAESCQCARRTTGHRGADDRPADRARHRGPVALGPRGDPARRRARGDLLRRHRARHRGRLPPSLHAPQLPVGALAQDPPGVDGIDGGRGFGRRLGRNPPAPSRVQRQARRPALTARVRTRAGRSSSAASCTRTSAGCSRPTTTSAERYAPDLLADADTMIISRLFPIFADRVARGTVLPRLDDHGVAQRRAHRVPLGGARPHDAAAPRDVERQLDLPHVRQAARHAEGPRAPTSRRSGSSRSVRRGTTSTTRSRARPATVRCRTRSTPAPR